jgi:hypothetical protein
MPAFEFVTIICPDTNQPITLARNNATILSGGCTRPTKFQSISDARPRPTRTTTKPWPADFAPTVEALATSLDGRAADRTATTCGSPVIASSEHMNIWGRKHPD